jgi:signal transduction histidine kinase
MNERRALPLKVWLVGGIVAMVLVAYAGAFIVALVSENLLAPKQAPASARRDPQSLTDLYQRVESQSARWHDAQWWAATVRPELEQQHVGLTVVDADNRVLYTFPDANELISKNLGWQPYQVWDLGAAMRRVVVYDREQLVGSVTWNDIASAQSRNDQPQTDLSQIVIPVGIVVTVLLTIWGAVTLASRAVFKPLGALEQATERINRGDLDFEVPITRIREVNDFARAFAGMRDGLKESLSAQAALEQERRLFVAAVAHDLRTPLTSVRGYLEGIRDGVARTPGKVDQYVGVALNKTASLERLVDGLFAYSRTEYLDQLPQKEPLHLGALVAAAAQGIRPQAEAKGVRLVVDAGPEDCTIQGDSAMLHRVLDNLLDNALRYTATGGEINVGWRAGIDHGRVWVQDSGPGIPEEDLEQVFRPLYRSDRARGTRTGGAGLGLAIARRLVEAHGGSITVENRGGARFTVTLPATAAAE